MPTSDASYAAASARTLLLDYGTASRVVGSQTEYTIASTLTDALARVLRENAASAVPGSGESPFGHVLERRSNLVPPAPRKTVATGYKPSADFQPSDTSNLVTGQRVEHPKFGFGTVSKLETQAGSTKAIIQFEEVGEKTLLLSFAKLRVLS